MIITELNDERSLAWLSGAVSRAARDGLRVRISQGVGNDGKSFVKFAVGGSMWTPPMTDESGAAPVVSKPALYVGDHGEPVVRPLLTGVEDGPTPADDYTARWATVPYYGD